MTKTNGNGSGATSIHISLQGKGGVGKSLISAILSQYLLSKGHDVVGIDADPHEALGSVEKEARKAGIAVREEIQKDIDAGRLHARELIVELNRAYSRSAVRRWVAVGVIAASGLLVLGVGFGLLLARVLK